MTTKSAFQVSTTEMENADNQGQKQVTQARINAGFMATFQNERKGLRKILQRLF